MNRRVQPRKSSGHFLPRCSTCFGPLFEDYLHVRLYITSPIFKACPNLSVSSSHHQWKTKQQQKKTITRSLSKQIENSNALKLNFNQTPLMFERAEVLHLCCLELCGHHHSKSTNIQDTRPLTCSSPEAPPHRPWRLQEGLRRVLDPVHAGLRFHFS